MEKIYAALIIKGKKELADIKDDTIRENVKQYLINMGRGDLV